MQEDPRRPRTQEHVDAALAALEEVQQEYSLIAVWGVTPDIRAQGNLNELALRAMLMMMRPRDGHDHRRYITSNLEPLLSVFGLAMIPTDNQSTKEGRS